MRNENVPINAELPSMSKLIKSTVLAICIAAILLVTIVLPAEYGIDPTGAGNAIGLLQMGEIKVSLSQEAAAKRTGVKDPEPDGEDGLNEESDETPIPSNANARNDEMTFSLSPNEGKEIKLTMAKGGKVNYLWWTDGGRANFDTHADSKKLEIDYHNYSKGSKERREGVLEAAFDGKHGWFWRNRTSETMTITLRVNGEYSDIKQLI